MPLDTYDPTELVSVTRQHLQEILAALSWCHGYSSAVDLMEGFRKGEQTPRASPMTKLVAQAYNHTEGYLNDDSIAPE